MNEPKNNTSKLSVDRPVSDRNSNLRPLLAGALAGNGFHMLVMDALPTPRVIGGLILLLVICDYWMTWTEIRRMKAETAELRAGEPQ